MKQIKYFLEFVILFALGCSSKKGEYTRKVESKLELMERHLSEGERAKAKQVQEDVAKILVEAFGNLMGIMEDMNKVLFRHG